MSESDFDGRTMTYTCDAVNRMTSGTNSLGQTFRFEHDSLGKAVVKDIDGEVTTLEHDIVGELAAATGTTAMRSRLWGRHGRLRSGTVNGRTAIHQYDRLGRRVGRTTAGGVVSEWTFDAAERRNHLTTSGREVLFERDSAGRELIRHIGETITLTHLLDSAGRLARQDIKTRGRSLQRRDHTCRADGSLARIGDQLDARVHMTWTSLAPLCDLAIHRVPSVMSSRRPCTWSALPSLNQPRRAPEQVIA